MNRIFLHGLGQDAASWDGVCSLLEAEAACPELTSFFEDGESTYQNLYQGFSAYCGTLDSPLDICGLSLGAVLALNYALDHPERVNSLALIAPQYKMPRGLLRFQNLLFRLMPQAVFEGAGLKKRDMLSLTGSMLELDFTTQLGALKCPVLVLCGERDRVNRKAAISLAAKVPGAVFQTVKGADHEVNREAPEELAKLLKEFFQSTALYQRRIT